MRKLSQTLINFVKDESGPTAVEYAVMLALIVVVCITAITTLGTNANNTFSYVGNKIGGAYTFPFGLKVGLLWDKSKVTAHGLAGDT